MRYDDWGPRLTMYLRDASREPFGYGSSDCALFAAGAVQAITGQDLAADFRGKYATYHDGLRLTGAARLSKLVDGLLSLTDRAHAHRGDIAWVVEPTEPDGRRRGCLMVVDGAYLIGPAGQRRGRSAGARFWRVD